jgi:predicted small metal-binding protein
MKEFSCESFKKDGCKAVLTARTEERLTETVAQHLRDVHGIPEISEDTYGQIKRLFVTRSTPDAAYVVDRIFEKYNCNSDPQCTWRYIAEAEQILTGSSAVHEKELVGA